MYIYLHYQMITTSVMHFRMLDLGYEKDVGEIVNALDSDTHRQTILLSATLTEGNIKMS